ncbi:MAG: hypothetical protein Kow00121_39290 [Elainellaceae cyanobacterium]
MCDPERIQIGALVKILQPAYAAGKIGTILCQEELDDGSITDRWLIEIKSENIVLSLAPHEFQVID